MANSSNVKIIDGVKTDLTIHEIQLLKTSLAEKTGFAGDIMSLIIPEEYYAGKLVCSLVVTPEVANWAGNMHGGAFATIADNLTTYAIISADKDLRPGVSLELSTTYIKAAPLGCKVQITSTVHRSGRFIAFSECVFSNPANGQPYAITKHTKFLVSSSTPIDAPSAKL